MENLSFSQTIERNIFDLGKISQESCKEFENAKVARVA